MNELKVFEGQNVQILIEEGEPYFHLESTSIALGQYKEVNGVKYARKERIAANLHGTDIVIFVRNGQDYINEEGLFELMLEMRTEKVRPFRKWVVSEVLPTIRKTGKYSIVEQDTDIPQTYAQALRAYADTVEALEIAEQKAQHAITTKAEIGSRREATAMNTASQAVKQVKRLEVELDRSKEYASVKAIERITGAKINWRPLRDYCTANELEFPHIFDPNFGKVRTYPAEAWQEVCGINLNELF